MATTKGFTLKICVENHSTVVSKSELALAESDFKHQLSVDVRNAWGSGGTLYFHTTPKRDDDVWQIVILDDSDQAGALGYHDYTPGGKPISKVFAKTDKDNGYSWTVTFSHEMCEMVIDPWTSMGYQVTNTRWYAAELCDPVESDDLGYKGQNGTMLSDFIHPHWFIPGSEGPYDQCGQLTKPLQVLPGGYAQYFENGKWNQVNEKGRMALEKGDPRFRDRSKGIRVAI